MNLKKILSLIVLAGILSLVACGKAEEKKPEPTPAPKEEPKEEPKAEVNPAVEKSIKAYEDFVTRFCALADKTAGASIMEKATLTAQFTKDAANLKALQADAEKVKSESNDAQKARIAAAGTKAAGCLKKGAM
ncbi:MAG: hypothetical protein SFU98_10800 [Leptospiraceae bacterium]|nr:hypothetical protein [Leptospiraceae bacterium]